MTLIEARKNGTVRRCTAACYASRNGGGRRCRCVCSGKNHGVGLDAALDNLHGIAKELCDAGFAVWTAQVQLRLF